VLQEPGDLDSQDALLKVQWLQQALDARGVQLWFIVSARGLQKLHRAKVMHRDIKPDNQLAGDADFIRKLVTGEIQVTAANFAQILARLEVRAIGKHQNKHTYRAGRKGKDIQAQPKASRQAPGTYIHVFKYSK
jgi:hypothetical protein